MLRREVAPPGPIANEPSAEAGVTPTPGAVDGGPVSTTTDAGVDARGAPTTVPIFIAQGKLGRTTISCDDGKTWVADRSENETARCWDTNAAENIECDHNSWSSVGMVAADGKFLATYGWGYAGVVRRTEDGVFWEDVLPGHTFAGLAYGNGRVIANDHTPQISMAAGAAGSWNAGAAIESTQWTVRRIAFAPDGGGRFIISLDGSVQLSDDNGASWREATTRPDDCAKAVIDIVHGNGVTVMVQNDGSVCRSTDRGDTWTHVPVTTSFTSSVIFGGGAFMVWQGSTRYSSTDGLTWTNMAGTAGVNIGTVTRSENGTFVAVNDGWQQWYEKQHFFRSTDGVTWEVLPATAFKAGHPITHMIAGRAKPSTECPLPSL